MNPIIGDPVMQRAVEFLKDRYTGQTCSIVGKGPSLKYLRTEHIRPGPVIVLNEAIIHVQKCDLSNDIYSMQKDGGMSRGGYDGSMVQPLEHIWLILQLQYSSQWFPDHPKRLIVDPIIDFHMLVTEMSIRIVLQLAKIMGCSKINLICCDSLVNGDLRHFTRDGVISSGSGNYLYEYVRPLVLKDLKDIEHEFILPEEEAI